jgi:hypothetical protein
MKFITAILLLVVSIYAKASEIGVVFQSHDQAGYPYWVVTCYQADECYEIAYRKCGGAYIAMDKEFYPNQGFRFLCNQPKKLVKK